MGKQGRFFERIQTENRSGGLILIINRRRDDNLRQTVKTIKAE